MNITLNGKQKDLPSPCTLTQILNELQLPAESIVIEVNGSIIQPDAYDETRLAEGDQVEIIRFVGGG